VIDLAGFPSQAHQAWDLVKRFRWLLLGSVTLFGLGGLVFAALSPKNYLAHQPFLIRDETSSRLLSGKFQSLEWLKSAQETVQEVAKHPDVLSAALRAVGPEQWMANPAEYPSQLSVEDFRDQVWISAPSGNELGKSEVIHLNVKASTRDRALKLAQHISQGVAEQLRIIRTQRAASIEAEVAAAVASAETRLAEVTAQVVELESSLGQNLIELRAMMDEKSSGESALLKPFLLTVEAELLAASNRSLQIDQDIAFFQSAVENPQNLLGMPNDLLEQYQSLRELKTILISAQVNMSEVAARYQEAHIKYQEAQHRILNLEQQIRQELQVSIANAQARKTFAAGRIEALTAQKQQRLDQLKHLAELRAPYQNLMAVQTAATNSLKQAQDELAQARAATWAAAQSDLLTPMEEPQVGTRSVGTSRTLIVLGSILSGIMAGLGLLMFFTADPVLASPSAIAHWQDDAA
jgi:uncharacterized protein involved in exopolysaccharide biosynthesis